MPVFTMLFFILGCTFAAIFDKLIILCIATGVGLVIDVIIWIVETIRLRSEPPSGFGIDWGA